MYAIPTEVHEPLLIHGDALEELRKLPSNSVDVCIADQPSGLGFMSKPWDSFAGYEPKTRRGREADHQLGGGDLLARAAACLAAVDTTGSQAIAEELRAAASARALMPPWARGFVAFCVDLWSEVFRVLKPGAFACVWALPKTADLAALALRSSDFETRDSDKPSRKWVEIHECVLHLFGSGMNKAGCIGKQIDKMHGAEREDLGEHVYAGGHIQRSAESIGYGGCDPAADTRRITAPATDDAKRWTGWHSQIAPGHEQWLIGRKPSKLTYARQLLEHGCGAFNVDACRVPRGEALVRPSVCRDDNTALGSGLGQGSQVEPTGSHPRNVILTPGGEGCPVEGLDRQSGVQRDGVAVRRNRDPNAPANGARLVFGEISLGSMPDMCHGGSGGASRYFTRFDQVVKYCGKASDRSIPGRSDLRNEHPTHKHPELMRWLVRLMAATSEHTGDAPAVVLDWCMGSGTTGVACVAEGVSFIGIEKDPVSVRQIIEPGPPGIHAAPRGRCALAGTKRVRTRHKKTPPRVAPAPSPWPAQADPYGDQAMSYWVARSRIYAAIGSPEEAAKANELAPVGAQLGLL